MSERQWQQRIERQFDGESPEGDGGKPETSEQQAHLGRLHRLRDGVKNAASRQVIEDAQFPAFMDGIREQIEAPRTGHHRLWTFASLTAAALIVAASTFITYLAVTNDSGPGVGTVVEAYESDIPGATVDSSTSEDGTASVWVTVPERDIQ
jgi:hypothetical protein